MAAQPYIEHRLYANTTPRPVEARGNLAEFERLTIEIFEHVSPSVVQVVGRAGGNDFGLGGSEGSGAQSGTGFVWDGAGHVVTNDHVVEGTTTLAVSLDSSVENVHFRTDWLDFKEIGFRAAGSAISDLAAEGATPFGIT